MRVPYNGCTAVRDLSRKRPPCKACGIVKDRYCRYECAQEACYRQDLWAIQYARAKEIAARVLVHS